MANSFCLLVARAALPAEKELAQALSRAKLPLVFAEPWSWEEQSGWLPMSWRKAESGCEVEVGKLSHKDAAAAKKAGHAGFDTVVEITPRGWESLQAGAALAAAIASVAGGCIVESDDDYIGAGEAMKWARRVIKGADASVKQEQERAAAKLQASAAGNVDARFEQALAAMAGVRIKQFVSVMDRLGFILDDGSRVSAAAWRVTARDGTQFDQTRYATLRGRQYALMRATPGAEERRQIEAIDEQLHAAGEQDEAANAGALAEIRAWPESPPVESMTWTRPGALTARFADGIAIEFVPTAMNPVECTAASLVYVLDGTGVALR